MLASPANWWNALNPLWKVTGAILAGITTVSAAWKPVSSTWEWWTERGDSAVLDLLRGRENVARAMSGFVVPEPTSVTFIAQVLKSKPQRVYKSLLRLERKEKVHRELGGWQFGPTPVRPQVELDRWK